MGTDPLYPDPGGVTSDLVRLEHAVRFQTARRAHTAARIIRDAQSAADGELLFLAVEAMEEKMTATEDVLGWLLVLHRWMPGVPGHALYDLLDKVRVRPKEEKELAGFLTAMDAAELQLVVLRASDSDLARCNVPPQLRESIRDAAPSILAGLRRTLDFRRQQDRRLVRAFNKSKHLGLGFVAVGRDGTMAVKFISGHDGDVVGTSIATRDSVRQVAVETYTMQAALHSTLAVILLVHYPVEYASPPWILATRELDEGWADSEDADEKIARLVKLAP